MIGTALKTSQMTDVRFLKKISLLVHFTYVYVFDVYRLLGIWAPWINHGIVLTVAQPCAIFRISHNSVGNVDRERK